MADGRHASSSRIKPAYLITGGVAVVVVAFLGFVLLRGGTDGLPIIGNSTPPTPPFAFVVTKVLAVPTRTGITAAKLKSKAKPAATEVEKAMNALYIGAFLDPGNWQHGSYDDVWGLFDTGASAEAQQQVDTITAGTGAGDAFDTILPDQTAASLKTKVLFDQKDQPFSVVAIVHFEATGSGKGARDLQMKSEGQFVFQQVDGTWKIVSFRVLRNDIPAATPTVTRTTTPTASPS
ncbi:MAG: hypothetical protein ACRDH7_04025 [Actinomycetota bacterium]